MTSTVRHAFPIRSSRDAFVGRLVKVRVDEVEMPGGTVATREVVEHRGAVAIAAIDGEGQVVLIDQYRHPHGRRLLELPAGLLDVDGEKPAATAQRELAEEVHLAAGSWSVLLDVATSPGMTDEVVRVFLATDLRELAADGHDAPDDEESDVVVRRVALDEAIRMALAGEIINGPTIAGIFAAHAVLTGRAAARPVDAEWPSRPTRFGRGR